MADGTTSAEAIAAGLTEAQKRTVLQLTDELQPARRNTFSAVAAFNLVSCGLTRIACVWTNEFPNGRDCYRLSPLGLAVRQHLERNPQS
jgi:chromosome condensin MukBEF complex kleisin-like MukF subunit